MEKICTFYQLKELEIYGEIDSLLNDEQEYEAEQDGNGNGSQDGRRPTLAKARTGSLFKSFNLGKRRRASTLTRSQNNIEEEGESDDDANERTGLRKTRSRDQDPFDMTASSNFDDISRRRPSTSDNIDSTLR